MKAWMPITAPGMLLLAAAAAGQLGYVGTTSGMGAAVGIKGAPFSAETVVENTHVLADGNNIHTVTKGRIIRDSEGRIRIESGVPGVEDLQSIVINDPEANVIISFASKSEMTPAEKVAFVRHTEPPSAPAAENRAPKTRPSSPPGTESLAPTTIEGYEVYGTKRISAVEAGKLGNQKPLVTTSEVWHSDELDQDLLIETEDPRAGHTTVRLVNIQRIEPDAALFQPPPDYAVKE